jgi:hypothetical protein
MLENDILKTKKKIKYYLIFFIVGLILSGVTAFPIETGLFYVKQYMSILPIAMQEWINKVYIALHETNEKYPFLAYGTDWLGFAHIVIAMAFIGPLRDLVKNIWIIEFGMIACLMVIPLAFIAGSIRQIPFFWQLIDCSFGVFGIIPLYFCWKEIKKLEYILV